MDSQSQEIENLVARGRFAEALSLGKMAISNDPTDEGVIAALRKLTAVLRSECMDLAGKKQDCTSKYSELELILRQANEYTHQDMYGRPL